MPNNELNVFVSKIPVGLNHLSIQDFNSYVVFEQLARGLIHEHSKNSNYSNYDLAESITTIDHRTFEIKLKLNQTFSNGEKIDACAVKNSIDYTLTHKMLIHGSLHDIQELKATGPSTLSVTLCNPNKDFLSILKKPEFFVYHKSDLGPLPSYSCTSGFYSLSEVKENGFVLKSHPHLQIFPKRPQWLTLTNSEDINFQASFNDKDVINRDDCIHTYDPLIGFTYFIGVNDKTIPFQMRSRLNDAVKRLRDRQVQGFFATDKLCENFPVEDGPGKSQSTTEMNTINTDYSARFLLDDRVPFGSDLVKEVSKLFPNLQINRFSSYEQCRTLLQKSEFDLVLLNNDFNTHSPCTAFESLFRPTPLIPNLNLNSTVREVYGKFESEQEIDLKFIYMRQLHSELLRQFLVIPLFRTAFTVYGTSELDFSQLNSNGDLSLFKIIVSEKNGSTHL